MNKIIKYGGYNLTQDSNDWIIIEPGNYKFPTTTEAKDWIDNQY